MEKCAECDRPVYARTLCSAHYQQARLHGTIPESVAVTRTCAHPDCDELLASRTSARAKYCTPQHKDDAIAKARRAAAVAAAGERRCPVDGNVIPPEVTLKKKCCSPKCSEIWQNRKRAETRLAAWQATDPRCQRQGCDEPIPVPKPGERRRSKYHSAECKKAEMDERWRERHPHYNRLYNYGITEEQWAAMLAAQDEKCAICRTDEWPGKDNRPHADHDHVTGRFRGILCGDCNLGLGKFHDDPARLQAAIGYLNG